MRQTIIDLIDSFFDAKTNEDIFEQWHAVTEALDLEPGTTKSWFYYFCYERIRIVTETQRLRLYPGGFEYDDRGRKVIITCPKITVHTKIQSIPLAQAKILLPDPFNLYKYIL